jgi:hypothetical protein
MNSRSVPQPAAQPTREALEQGLNAGAIAAPMAAAFRDEKLAMRLRAAADQASPTLASDRAERA